MLSEYLIKLHAKGPIMKTGERYIVTPIDSMGSKGWAITPNNKVFIFYGDNRQAAEDAANALNLFLAEQEASSRPKIKVKARKLNLVEKVIHGEVEGAKRRAEIASS